MTREIQIEIEQKFHPKSIGFVTSLIQEVYEAEWGVGKEHLVRSLLRLSDGSLDKLMSYFPIIDPRDIIMEAM